VYSNYVTQNSDLPGHAKYVTVYTKYISLLPEAYISKFFL
jgi:hypothetical protein